MTPVLLLPPTITLAARSGIAQIWLNRFHFPSAAVDLAGAPDASAEGRWPAPAPTRPREP